MTIVHSQYQDIWWPGDIRSWGIKRHAIDLGCIESFLFLVWEGSIVQLTSIPCEVQEFTLYGEYPSIQTWHDTRPSHEILQDIHPIMKLALRTERSNWSITFVQFILGNIIIHLRFLSFLKTDTVQLKSFLTENKDLFILFDPDDLAMQGAKSSQQQLGYCQTSNISHIKSQT